MAEKELDLFNKKIKLVNNRSFVLDFVFNIEIHDNDIVGVAFWNTPVMFYTLKILYPNTTFIMIEDISIKNLYGVDENDIIYVDIDNKEYFPNMKFDKIIMNPPYNKNLHLKILEEALNHITKDGKIASIQPDEWLINPYIDYVKDKTKYNAHYNLGKHIETFNHLSTGYTNKVFGTSSWFGTGIFCFVKNETAFDLNQFKSNNDIMKKLLVKMMTMNSLRSQFDKLTDNNLQVPVRRNNHGYLSWVAYGGNATEGIIFKSEIEKNNFINSFDTWLYKYINLSDWSNKENSAMIPFMDDYTHEWTDEDFYTFFNITKEEQKVIEDTIKEYE